MDKPSLSLSVMEMADKFLEGITCAYELYIAESKMSGAGSGLFVREEVPAGKEIFHAAVPAVAAVESAVDACDNCFAWKGSTDPFTSPVRLLMCGPCKAVKYCSKGCQRAAWRRYHKEECKIKNDLLMRFCVSYCGIDGRTLKPKELTLAIRMLIRLLVLHRRGQLTDNQWQAILELKSHKGLIEQSEVLDLAEINADIRLVKEVTEEDMPQDNLRDLYWRIKFNQHSVDSPMQPRLGSCLVPSAALINHSCRPNSHHLSEGAGLVVRSCRKIEKDEEITISYIGPTQCFKERQNALSNAYCFDCECPRCALGSEAQGKMFTRDPVLDIPTTRAKSRLDDLLSAIGNDDQELGSVEAKMREICNDLFCGKPWPIHMSPIPNIYVTLAKLFEDNRHWEKALHLWLKIVYVIDPLRYPDRLNIHRVEDLMALSQLEIRISHESVKNSAVKANFHAIEAAMSVVQYGHNVQLKDDAAASVGTNHVIYKTAASYVEASDQQMLASMGIPPNVWQSESFLKMREESFKAKELELLSWAGIDLTAKVI